MNGLTPHFEFLDDESKFDIIDISFSKNEGYFYIIIFLSFYYPKRISTL